VIHFFRRIRHEAMEKNPTKGRSGKSGQYLKYAVGEIILVVVGILIALQINAWSSFKKERQLEQNLLQSLKAEFERNLIELDRDHALNITSQNATLALLDENRLEFSRSKTDSLIGASFNYAAFDARTGTFDETIASGNLRLIQDDSLKALLGKWSGELNDLQADVILRQEHLVHSASPSIRKFLPLRNMDKANYREDYARILTIKPLDIPKSNYNKFYNSLEVDGVLYELYLNQAYVTIGEVYLRTFIVDVIKSLEQNIRKD
jgi:uncharacterized protein DUF6090